MNVVKEIERITALELSNGIIGGVTNGSWHDKYKNSAWVYLGGLSTELTEGDIICVMSQWGEIEDINLVREKGSGKSMGFAFIKYEDQRSTILAVDNFNGIKLVGRVLRCDHVDKYKLPKEVREREEEMLEANPTADVDIGPGHAYKAKTLASQYTIEQGIDLWAPAGGSSSKQQQHQEYLDGSAEDISRDEERREKRHKEKKVMKDKKDRKHRHKDSVKPSSPPPSSSDRHDKSHKKPKYDDDGDDRRDEPRGGHNYDRDRVERPSDRDRKEYDSLPSRDRGTPPFTHIYASSLHLIYSIVCLPTDFKPPSDASFGSTALSWRGRRDPASAASTTGGQASTRPPYTNKAATSGGVPAGGGGRDIGQGYGGMNRLR